MKRLVMLALVAAALALAAGGARADVTLQMTQNGSPQQLYLKTHMLAVTNPDGVTIFRGDKKVLWTLNTADKTCREMTEADAQAAGEQLGAASAQMEEAMKNLPPEQRAMMEKMMAKRMPPRAAGPSDRLVTPTGQNRTINGFACAGYVVKLSDGATTEVWTADPAAAHLEPADLTVFTEFADFMENMLGQMGIDRFRDMVKDYAHPKAQDVPGLPILTVMKDASGKEIARTELVRIDRRDIAEGRFAVPAGYRKEPMMKRASGD